MMRTMYFARPSTARTVLFGITVLGLAVRVASARGGLWLDEAWSAVFARDVGTPMGVIFGINHDNNHPINTLWLLAVGFGADPIVQRSLSIACGTATVVLAGLVGARRNAAAGIVTALLFAVSPVLVTYGSEARGYAPMLLAAVAAFAAVDAWLDRRDTPAPRGLAAIATFGMFAQLTMALALAAIGGWMVLRLVREIGWKAAIRSAGRALAPALIASILVTALYIGIPVVRGTFHFGSLEAFDSIRFAQSLGDLAGYTVGGPTRPQTAIAFAVATLFALPFVRGRGAFYALAILGLPLLIVLVQPANGAIGRYYLPSAIAFLILAGEIGGLLWTRGGAAKAMVAATLLTFVLGAGYRDSALIANLRADPARAVAEVARRAPVGAEIAIDLPRSSAILESAAATRGYRLNIGACARFLFVERDGDTPFPPVPVVCNRHYRPIAAGHPSGLSGTHWTLYETAR